MTISVPSKKRILYGVSNFEEFRTKGGYLVDKTEYIEALEEIQNPVFLRPRRFGKSMWCSILRYYYDLKEKEKFEALFGDTHIGRNPTPHQGSYLALQFDFSVIRVKDNMDDIEKAFDSHCNGVMARLVSQYQSLFPNQNFLDLKDFAATNLDRLCQQIATHDLPPLYVIIDEYDNFANQLITSNQDLVYSKLTTGGSFFRTFFKVLKAGRQYGAVSNVFVTGVLPITMDDLTSAYNIASMITLEPEFIDMLGYRQEEVTAMLDFAYETQGINPEHRSQVESTIKNHYNGYQFSLKHPSLYNPTILCYFMEKLCRHDEITEFLMDDNLKTDVSWIRRLTSHNPEQTKELVESLAFGQEMGYSRPVLRQKFNMHQFFQKDYYPLSLFYLGMLTLKDHAAMKVPNHNMLTLMMEYFNEIHQIDVSTRYMEMVRSFTREPNMSQLFENYWNLYISQLPEAVFQKMNENFYRTTFFDLCRQFFSMYYTFNVERSYPSGRSDLEFVGKINTPVANQWHVIEFKYWSNQELRKAKKTIKTFEMIPEDRGQLDGYCIDLLKEFPEAQIQKYVIYCFGNKGYRVFPLGKHV